ncbi:hypothetical protein Golomagni_03188 [Golovinomyces magnicellulatus]|nr:hypothetical protein Golomagni_03188 [Golovinomyces magnicellulatus]
MNGRFDTLYSAEELNELITSRRSSWLTPSISISTTDLNHDSLRSDNMDNSIISSNCSMAGQTLHDIITQNDNEILRWRNFPRQLANGDAQGRCSDSELCNGDNGLKGIQYTASKKPINEQMWSDSINNIVDESYKNNEPQQIFVCPPNKTSQNVQEQSLITKIHRHVENLPTSTLENTASTQVSTETFINDDNYGMSLCSPQYSLNVEGSNLDQINNDYLMTPQQESIVSHLDSTQNGDPSNFTRERPQADIKDKPNISLPKYLPMTQPQINISSPRTMDTQSLSQIQELSFHIGPSPSAIGTNSFTADQTNFKYRDVYCQSGFDLLGALMKVVSRKNPVINIGKVDLSCAFTVCDVLQYDCPIVYVSGVFERLTGYNQYEVKGQNCRFLQSPDGKVEAGTRREFVDNDSVRYLREKVSQLKEAQRSIINYRKGGQPFMNILTIIPITGEDNISIRYFVGFQVDLVEMPASVQGKTSSGIFNINYSQDKLPRYIWQSPGATVRQALNLGQSFGREDFLTVLASISAGNESELMKRMWDRILLENTEDVIHVLSLKGLFLYLSPSSRNVLEYDASELIGRALSAVCHPSDIVSVTRELKDTSTESSINVVFRIRRKNSGYTWFESHGSLCVEQGKGRKYIILVGRERPVYALDRYDIESAGGIGESDLWNKISTSGMFLFVSSNVRSLLDRMPSDLVGTSIQALMRAESKIEFGEFLEKARAGRIVTCKHEILGKRGLMMQAQTTLFPGDASEGQKPTFFVAQTKLIRPSSKFLSNSNTHLTKGSLTSKNEKSNPFFPSGILSRAGSSKLTNGSQNAALASEHNVFDELKTTRCTSWQFELRQMEKSNRMLTEELATLLSNRKKRKRRKTAGSLQKDCANCHTRVTPEWRRGPSGHRDLCNSCGLRYAKQERVRF